MNKKIKKIKSRSFENKIFNRVEEKILYQNPLLLLKKNPLRKIFRFEKKIAQRNIADFVEYNLFFIVDHSFV